MALRFGDFVLDPAERRLTRGGAPVEIGARYLDALVLLAGAGGALVTKERFMAEVWRGVPVTDEALTQCIRTLRRALGDDAAAPRFIATVAKHGYRFVAAVADVDAPAGAARVDAKGAAWLGGSVAGTIGAGGAGVVGGLAYGALAAAAPGAGAASTLLVVAWLTLAAALTGGAGVSAGVAAGRLRGGAWPVVGGAAGGLLVGGITRLLGLDAFHLLLGRAPVEIAGAAEGLALGGTVGLAAWAARRGGLLRRTGSAALVGAGGGAAIVVAGGRLMGGSLASLAEAFPGSRLHVELAAPALIPAGAIEGALFAGAIIGAVALADRASRR